MATTFISLHMFFPLSLFAILCSLTDVEVAIESVVVAVEDDIAAAAAAAAEVTEVEPGWWRC